MLVVLALATFAEATRIRECGAESSVVVPAGDEAPLDVRPLVVASDWRELCNDAFGSPAPQLVLVRLDDDAPVDGEQRCLANAVSFVPAAPLEAGVWYELRPPEQTYWGWPDWEAKRFQAVDRPAAPVGTPDVQAMLRSRGRVVEVQSAPCSEDGPCWAAAELSWTHTTDDGREEVALVVTPGDFILTSRPNSGDACGHPPPPDGDVTVVPFGEVDAGTAVEVSAPRGCDVGGSRAAAWPALALLALRRRAARRRLPR